MRKEWLVMVVGILMLMGNAWGAVPVIGFDLVHPGINVPLNDNITPVDVGMWATNTGDWTFDGSSATIDCPVVNVNSSLRWFTTLVWPGTEMPGMGAIVPMPDTLDWGFEYTYKHTGGNNGGIPVVANYFVPDSAEYRIVSLWQVSETSWTIKVGDADGQGWVNAVTDLDLSDGAFHKFTIHYKAATPGLDIYVDDVLKAGNVALGHGQYNLSMVQLEDADAIGTDSYGYVKVGQINPVTVQGTVELNGFAGDNTTVPISIEIRNVDNTTALESRWVTLAADGSYSFMTLLNGPHDISAQASQRQFLRQTQKSVTLSPASPVTVNFTLAGGDIDDDGEITSSDLSIVLFNMDKTADQ